MYEYVSASNKNSGFVVFILKRGCIYYMVCFDKTETHFFFIDSICLGNLHLNLKKYLYYNLHLTNIYFSEIQLSEKDLFLETKWQSAYLLYESR